MLCGGVQGQLNITERRFSDFNLYCDVDFNVERIYRVFHNYCDKMIGVVEGIKMNNFAL
ncbi:unnamed protein product [Acanthoscelides obtectus]|uniref:Uncharacterized protein n=1 Tax=Acanthoscelides obtectus TaxID=200917 RepID=A0A9P0JUC3_ACAOB|nr:unnamed protein product [Acanthoscelides obtectus]CAK1661806.1 hypothetical protein AOBTE_LOCUS22811 [Acanthoscelides obtectus]